MSAKEQVIKIRIDAVLGDINSAVNKLSEGLNKGVTKIDAGSSIGKSMSKNIEKYRQEYEKFSQLTNGGTEVKVGDSKQAIASGERLVKIYKDIQSQITEMGGASTENLKKLFPQSFDDRITKAVSNLSDLKSAIGTLGDKQDSLDKAKNAVTTYEQTLEGLKSQLTDTKDKVEALRVAEEGLSAAKLDESAKQQELEKLAQEAKDTQTAFEALRDEFVKKINLNADNVLKEINEIEKELEELEKKKKQALASGDEKTASSLQKQIDSKTSTKQTKERKHQALLNSSAKASSAKDAKGLAAQAKNAGVDSKEQQESLKKAQELNTKQLQQAQQVAKAEAELTQAKQNTKIATDQQKNAQDELNRANSNNNKVQGEIDRTTAAYEKQKAKVTQVAQEIETLKTKMATPETMTALKELIPGFDAAKLQTEQGIQEVIEQLKTMDGQKADAVRQELEKIGQSSDKTEDEIRKMKGAFGEVRDSATQLTEAQKEIDQLRSRLQYFFGITNTIQLFKRAVTEALNTVKELDKTMTEAAVVTDFSIGDMWDKLPQYANAAQELGVSINSMYQATTLYYQQGLKTNEAMSLGIETMKMGKIAAMDSTEATKAMTAALRGFNMELNETSAVRVNDVYSQLAAVTAADTAQIATAMEKTASIAASANMEFETTAALLAQIIETTQEAPETAGTAMKTIIARFSEVKSLQQQGKSSGTDSEGEDIDVNKIQTALRTVGISMDGFFAGTEGLDSILLKLAEKWATLDFETQRYIATMAAGSRQQSRFIAMMSDYGRTTELVAEAQSSAGASQKQFEKTQDSMETKLQRLENAWNEFLMGLSNNEILKGAIELITGLVEGLNKMTDSLNGGNGIIKSIISLITVIGALKMAGTVVGKLFGSGLGWAGEKMGLKGEQGAGGSQPSSSDSSQQTDPMPDAHNNGQKKGGIFANGFIQELVRVIKSRRGQVEAAVDETVEDKNGPEEGKKRGESENKNKGNPTGTTSSTSKRVAGTTKVTPRRVSGTPAGKKATGAEQPVSVPGAENTSQDLNKVTQSSEDASQALTQTGEAANNAGTNVQNMNNNLEENNQQNNQSTQSAGGLSQALGGVGMACMGAGMAMNLLASYLESMGLDSAANAVSVLGDVFMGLGSVLMVLPSLISVVGTVATAAGISTQAAWIWVVAIVVIIALLVLAVAALAQAWEDASDEAQLEKMNEQVAELGEAADEAKKKLEDMSAAREELEKLGGAFDGLIEGSKEWKQALTENNLKVLELIDTYPDLVNYIGKGIHGEMTISDEGWDAVMDEQMATYTTTVNAQTAMQQQRDEKELEMKTEEVLSENYGTMMAGEGASEAEIEAEQKVQKARMDAAERGAGANAGAGALAGAATGAAIGAFAGPVGALIGAGIGAIGGAIIGAVSTPDQDELEREQGGGLNYKEFDAFASIAADRGLNMSDGSLTKDEASEIFYQLGYDELEYDFDEFYSHISNMGSAFDELANSALAASAAEDARVDSVVSNVASTSKVVQNSDFGAAAEEVTAQTYGNYDDLVAEEAKQLTGDLDDKNLDSDEAVSVLEDYAEMNNMTVEEVRKKIEDGEISKETVANTVAAKNVDGQIKERLESTTKAFERVSKDKSKEDMNKFVALNTDRGKGLGINDVSSFGSMTKEQMTAYVNSMGFTADELKAMGYDSAEAYAEVLYGNAQDASKALENAFNDEDTLGLGDKFKSQLMSLSESLKDLGASAGLTVEQTTKLAKTLSRVEALGGDATAVMEQFPSLVEGLTGSTLDNAINLLSSTDWTLQTSIDSTIEALKSLGVSIDDDMAKKLYVATNAIKKLDLAKLEEKLQNLQKVVDTIKEKKEEAVSTYTKEERDLLISSGKVDVGDFVRIGVDEYSFMGETNQLLQAIDLKISDILGEMKTDVDRAVETGRKYDDVFKSTQKYAVGDGTSGSTTGTELTGAQIIQRLASGELDTVGVGGTNNVGRSTLENLAVATGILTKEQMKDYTDAMLADALVQNYNAHYGVSGSIYNANLKTQAETNREVAMYNVSSMMGEENFNQVYADTVDEGKKKKLAELESDNHTGISYYDILRDASIGEITEGGREQAKFLAQSMGMSNSNKASDTELAAFLNDVYADTIMADDAIAGMINSEAGLEVAVKNTTAQISAQGKASAKDSVAMANLTVAAHKANKEMDGLNKIISEQADGLKLGNKNNQLYREALSKTAFAAKAVFGDQVTEEFVEQNRLWFTQLAEGGEIAEQAYARIAQSYGTMIMLQKTGWAESSTEAQRAAQIINEAFNSLKPGESMDLTAYYAKLMEIEGMTQEAAMATMNAWGFTITTSTKKVWMKGGIISETQPNEEGWQEINMIVGTKESAVGTGINAPKGGGGGSSSKWENPYDEFYNSVAKINEELRERERLERRYQRLIDRNAATVNNIAESKAAQLESYETERTDRTRLLNGRKAQMHSILDQYSDVGEYATYNFETGQVEINWDALEALEGSTDEELTSRVEDYISLLEDQEGMIEEEEDALEEIEDGVWEIYDQGKDEYFDLENQVKEAIIANRQKEIDKLSEINDSINDTNSKLLDSMQQQIDEYRQTRDNAKTEKEISDKQRQLAYLQQDTSGANALQILSLQDEIKEAQEDYTDTLIDQKISELQTQNDKAAEQRQHQIDLMQAQLDRYSESAEIWNEVHSLIADGVDATTSQLKPGSELLTLLQDAAGFEGMSHLQKMDWLNELETKVATGLAWLESGAMQSLYGMGATVTFRGKGDKEGETRTGVINKDGDVIIKDKELAYKAGTFKINPETGEITSSMTEAEAKEYYKEASQVTEEAPPVTNVYQTYNSGGGGGTVYVGNPNIVDDEEEEEEKPSQTTTQPSYMPGLEVSKNTLAKGDYVFSMGAVPKKTDADGDTYVKTNFQSRWIKTKDVNDNNSKVVGGMGGAKTYKMIGPFKTYALDNFADRTWTTIKTASGAGTTTKGVASNINKTTVQAYKTGGLADFTGPAWLDGTKSKPEYVLNADQTKAFFTLVDVLGSLQIKDSKASQNSGDSIYDIDINVESIGSDYDVEQMADTIKRLINEDARYRNNNAINLMR